MPTPRRLIQLAVLLTLAVLLAGCVHVNRALTFNADGTGAYTLSLGFREPTPGDRASISEQIVAPLEAFGAHVVATGGVLDRTEDQGYAYWTFTRPFTSIANANALLQEDPRQDDPSHTPVLYHDTLHVANERQLFGNAIHVTGSISLVDQAGNAQAWKDATETLSITLAGGIAAHHGGALDGNTLTYSIAYNQSATVDVTGQTSGQYAGLANYLPLFVAGALALLAIFLLALALTLLRRAWTK